MIFNLFKPIYCMAPLHRTLRKDIIDFDIFFSKEEIEKHNNEDDIWVSYQGKVYNITEFVSNHPGGKEKLLQAAGGPLEPYWDIYTQHKNKEVKNILEEYQIGITDKYKEVNDPYQLEPKRNTDLNILKNRPFNAQPFLKELRQNYITPQSLWYVRNHHPVPVINPHEYRLSINGKNINSKKIDLESLKNDFDEKEIVCTIQCAGNRRDELNSIETTLGLPWNGGAISNGKWKGVLLKDLLADCGFNKDNYTGDEHIQFIGTDQPFDASISIRKIFDDNSDILVAYEMNDSDLYPDHGYPVRIVVPGYFGGKQVKWLNEIRIDDEESKSTWQRGVAYKLLPSFIKNIEDIKKIDITKITTITELPVTSIICELDGNLLKGIAYSGGGRNIIRVEVSNDNGETWFEANLKEGSEQKPYKAWAWTFWEINIEKKEGIPLISRAIDISYNFQPNFSKDLWNIRGILNNAYYKF